MNIKEKFTDSFAFYAAYHQHPVNQLMHIITIPFIVFTILTWCAYAEFYTPHLSDSSGESIEFVNYLLSVNFGLVLIMFYVTVYVVLDVLGGLLFLPFVLILYGGANIFRYYVPYAWAISIGIHIVAWIFQFAGHGVWEKRKPALFDSLMQAFLMAPFFIFMELLFRCGYKQEFQQEIDNRKYNYMDNIQYPIVWQ